MLKPYFRRAALTLAVMPAAFMAPALQASPFDLPPLDSIVHYQPNCECNSKQRNIIEAVAKDSH